MTYYTYNVLTPELSTIILNLTMYLSRLIHKIIVKPLKLINWLHNLFNLVLVLNYSLQKLNTWV